MSGLLLAVSAAGVAVMLVVLFYPSLAEYAEYRTGRTPYHPLADAEPLFEPRIIEVPVNPPDIEYPIPDLLGFVSAEYHPDHSATLTFADPDGIMPDHSQTYVPDQTFAYRCGNDHGYTLMDLYQYRGISTFRGEPSLILVQFRINVTENVPCLYPEFLRHTVDVYDAGDFDLLYNLRTYQESRDASYNHTTYVEPIKHMVTYINTHVDLFATNRDESAVFSHEGWITDMEHHADDSITVTYGDRWGNSTQAYSHNYKPGQSFLIGCMEEEETARIHVYYYRGSEILRWDDSPFLVFVHLAGYTRVPMPCTYPDVLVHSIDVFDTSRLDRQYDLEWYRDTSGFA